MRNAFFKAKKHNSPTKIAGEGWLAAKLTTCQTSTDSTTLQQHPHITSIIFHYHLWQIIDIWKLCTFKTMYFPGEIIRLHVFCAYCNSVRQKYTLIKNMLFYWKQQKHTSMRWFKYLSRVLPYGLQSKELYWKGFEWKYIEATYREQ